MAQFHEHKPSIQSLSRQPQFQIAPLNLRGSRFDPFQLKSAFIPDVDVSCPVIAFRYIALESGIVQRMVLYMNGQPFSPGSCGGPFGTAHDASAPFTWILKSKCKRLAAWRWTTKIGAFVLPARPLGSAVFRKLRLRLYSASSAMVSEYKTSDHRYEFKGCERRSQTLNLGD